MTIHAVTALNLDALLENAVLQAHLADGIMPQVALQRVRVDARTQLLIRKCTPTKVRPAAWTSKEDDFVRANYGVLAEDEMARRLGRSPVAVHLRRARDLRLPAPSKKPDELTGEQVAQGLAIDSKAAARLIDRGLLPGRNLPGGRHIRVVNRDVFLRWLIQPEHWVYFQPLRVGPAKPTRAAGHYDYAFWRKARRLVRRRYRLWNDEWWRIGQVADYLGVDHRCVNHAIRHHKIAALDWGNWWVLRSVAQASRGLITNRRGSPGQSKAGWTAAADAFLVLGVGLGISYQAIAAMMKMPFGRVKGRIEYLRRHKRMPQLIDQFRLRVRYDPATRALTGNWRVYRKRFKRFAAIQTKKQTGAKLTDREIRYLGRR